MIFDNDEATAKCRGCGMALRGKPYHLGGNAYHPRTGEQAKSNFFGGYVCSYSCDRRVSLDMLSSMPGAGPAVRLDSGTQASLNRNWSES